jgi:hypothetical protein
MGPVPLGTGPTQGTIMNIIIGKDHVKEEIIIQVSPFHALPFLMYIKR